MGGRDNTIKTRQARWVENQKGKNRAKLQGYISDKAKSLISKLVRERELLNQGAAIEAVLFEWLKLQASGDEAERARLEIDRLKQENGELRRERDDLKAQFVGITDGADVKQLIEKWRAKAQGASGPRWAQLKKFLEEYEAI